MAKKNQKPASEKEACITISKNGPCLVSGGLPLDKAIIETDREGTPAKWGKGEKFPKQERYALCRCGHSTNKPYCTGTHAEVGFVGTETATRKRYAEQAEKIKGAKVDLTDAGALCSAARFCHLAGGTWKLTEGSANPKSRKLAVQTACNCPSGRLVVWDKKTKKPIEPKLAKSISLIEDPAAGVSGPIWVKGGVQVVSSDGTKHEIRNRVALCRCGKSGNKPLCDGTHRHEAQRQARRRKLAGR
jgi:CDGSH-type Zn-finger protein